MSENRFRSHPEPRLVAASRPARQPPRAPAIIDYALEHAIRAFCQTGRVDRFPVFIAKFLRGQAAEGKTPQDVLAMVQIKTGPEATWEQVIGECDNIWGLLRHDGEARMAPQTEN